MGEIVGGRPQTARREHKVRPGGGLRKHGDEASFVIPDGGVAVDRDTQSRKSTAKPSCVGVHEASEEYFGSNGHDLGAHRLPALHVISPKTSFTIVGQMDGSCSDRRSPGAYRVL